MHTFVQLASKDDFETIIKPNVGKAVLLAFWPGDETSEAVIAALQRQLPPSSYKQYGVLDIYCFDCYSLPELASELNVDFVPTLMWFMDGQMDAIVWHDGVRVQGETVSKGVSRVVKRIKSTYMNVSGDEDSDW